MHFEEDDFAVEATVAATKTVVRYDGAVFQKGVGDQLSCLSLWHKANHSKHNANMKMCMLNGQVVWVAHN